MRKPPNAIGEPSANRAQEAAGENNDGGKVARSDFAEVVLVVKEDGKEARHANKPTKRQAIEQAKRHVSACAKECAITAPRLGRLLGGLLRASRKNIGQHRANGQQSDAKTACHP